MVVLNGAIKPAFNLPADVPITDLGAGRARTAVPRLLRHLRRAKPDIVFSPMGYLNLIVLTLKPFLQTAKVIVREANRLAATQRVFQAWFPQRTAYRLLYACADAVVVQTPSIARELGDVCPGAMNRITIIPNPVDEDAIRATLARPSTRRGERLVVGAGRLTQQKGFDRLIRAMTTLPNDVKLTIYGDGPERGVLQRLISDKDLHSRITMPGFKFDVTQHIAAADVFALPSRWEGLPNVALEALAVGTPVVAMADAGVEELAHDAGEAIVIAKTEADFASAVAQRLDNLTDVERPRPSLLPRKYLQGAVARQFEALFERVHSSR